LIKVEKEAFSGLKKQCQMLGITIWNVIEHAEWVGVVIKHDAYAKLELVFSEKIRNSEAVSLLTAVGLHVEGLVEKSYALLTQQGISVEHYAVNPQSLMLVLLPECVDKAANILHDAYITSAEALDCLQKHAFLG
jgi:aspartate kinase